MPPPPHAAVAGVARGDALPPETIAAEVARLRMVLAQQAPDASPRSEAADTAWVARAQSALADARSPIGRPQLLVVVDRNPAVQRLAIVLAQPGAAGWQVVGGGKVSTGQQGRRDYYITPTGVFPHTDAILDYRALGTFNENHIRGLGLRGMRVWDLGWHPAEKGWRADRELGDIRLLIHATDPDHLEQRLGHPASQGCVRVSAAMNRFLDRYGVLDAEYEHAARQHTRFAALLDPAREPTPLAGSLLVVVDSASSP
jgi:hypothetical protein